MVRIFGANTIFFLLQKTKTIFVLANFECCYWADRNVLLRISFTWDGTWTRFRFFLSIVLFCTPSRFVVCFIDLSSNEDFLIFLFFFFFLHESGFGCFFFFFFFATAATVGSDTDRPSLFLMIFSLCSSAVPNVNDSFILNSTAFRLSSDGCSNTGVFLWRYRSGWPGFFRRESCNSRSWLAITYRLFFIWKNNKSIREFSFFFFQFVTSYHWSNTCCCTDGLFFMATFMDEKLFRNTRCALNLRTQFFCFQNDALCRHQYGFRLKVFRYLITNTNLKLLNEMNMKFMINLENIEWIFTTSAAWQNVASIKIW